MTEKGSFEERLTALESEEGDLKHRLQGSEKDAAAARVLAGGADRDTSELRIELREFREQNMRLHNATRSDIADIRGDITEIRGNSGNCPWKCGANSTCWPSGNSRS